MSGMSSVVDAGQRKRAERFRALHRPGAPFVLGNAWDVASALVLEEAGFEAVGTSSAALAASLGRLDAEAVALEELVQVVRRISRALEVPLSVDVESGFGPRPADVAACVEKVLGAGAVGVNLEDVLPGSAELLPVEDAAERIAAARAAADRAGIPAVINARTDVFWRKVGPEEQRVEEALKRLRAYVQAGADAVFVPGAQRKSEIAQLAARAGAPLNLLASRDLPPLSELARLDVARLSHGSAPMRAALTTLRRVAEELRGPGTYTSLTEDVLSYAELQALLGNG
jgi:2-methylisocitrate lyase-like PEP mutase family enzyme